MHTLLRAAALGLCLVRTLQAQAPAGAIDSLVTVLAVPEGHAVLCRTPTTFRHAPVPAGSVLREFKFGRIPGDSPDFPREIAVAFDSSGTPQLLVDVVMLGPPANTTMVVTSLDRTGSTPGVVLTVKLDSARMARVEDEVRREGPGALEAALPRPESRPITPDEQAAARRLAVWLWERRCER